MRVPKIKDINKAETNEVSVVKIENFGKASFYSDEINEPKQYVKFIKRIEKIIRTSIEYRNYIGYLKNELDIKKCSFLPQVNINEIKGVGLEMHHYPLTLFDLVAVALNHRMAEAGHSRISPFTIANDVMKAHYENKVGIVPLSKTVHELAHSGEIFISLNQVFGDIKGYLDEYHLGLTDELKEQLRNLIQLTDTIGESYDPEVLRKAITYYEIDEYEKIKEIPKEERILA
jgi:hypothetical protein